ncbi:hypothetical protein LIER_07597 [Lithospermum erythrorhizon]|uniref:Gfo/Idh/MocA-like oxidoreductase N-terminal domain-containing protein n=1 Tax=Lithospermum erythrorhizon TaxID=34254 RepID=A0AAV3P9S4_LITER
MSSNDVKLVRFGIMGCAGIARKVSRAITLSPNATLYAISSRSFEKAQQFAIKNGLPNSVKLYGSYNELLDDDHVDVVYMPLPTSLHVKWATLAAERKKHVLLEKPTALCVADLDVILEACEANGVQFMDGSMWYHHPRTGKMKELLDDSKLFGQVKNINSSSSFIAPEGFFENDIRVKPDLDALGALGDAGWYCLGAILWAMNQKLPTTVTALPAIERNAAGVIMSCSASFHWEEDGTIATFYCSFYAHETMDLATSCSNGTMHFHDFIIPFQEQSARFSYTSDAKFADLHVGWNMKPQEVELASPLPQEAMMIQEFARLVENIRSGVGKPDSKWPQTSRATQLVLDAVRTSIELGFQPVRIFDQMEYGWTNLNVDGAVAGT